MSHVIDKKGLHAAKDKVNTAPLPRNPKQLGFFLGLINNYGQFIKNLASLLYPLNCLLQQNSKWVWSREYNQAFKRVKAQLLSAEVSVHYHREHDIVLATDASAYGLGAVLSHIDEGGNEKPVAFASRTLTIAERNYSQLEKEKLSIVFWYREYLYGCHFRLLTDHKPLVSILGPKTGVPTLAAARLQ